MCVRARADEHTHTHTGPPLNFFLCHVLLLILLEDEQALKCCCMEEPVVGHPVHLGLFLVVLVPHLRFHMFASEEKEVVHLFYGLECFLRVQCRHCSE